MGRTLTVELQRAMELAAEKHASDLFLLPGEPISLRIGGTIQRMDSEPLTPDLIRQMALGAVGDERLSRLHAERGCIRASCDVEGVISGRMSIAQSRGDHTIVIRLLPRRVFTPAELRFPPALLEAATLGSGLVLFSGIAGSGKTTSAFALLEHINATWPGHICTIEDPISFVMTPKKCLIQQREVGIDAPDVAGGMIAAIGQDPDVLFVGELRTPAEVYACVTAAQLGHLVITQLHASTAAEALTRFADSQSADASPHFRRELARVLRLVCAQVLLPARQGGRLAAYDVLVADQAMREAIAQGKPVLERSAPLPEGCQKFEQSIAALASAGEVEQQAVTAAMESIRPHA